MRAFASVIKGSPKQAQIEAENTAISTDEIAHMLTSSLQ